MKSIKNIVLGAFVILAAFCAVTYSSCSKKNSNPDNPCLSITCQNGGVCDSASASCTCATGYEGSRCDTVSRTKFIKTWAATDVNVATSVALSPYSSVISAASTAVTDVLIGNFSSGYFTNAVKATVTHNTITIASQQPDNDGFSVAGTGTFSGNKIAWTYTITRVSDGMAISYSGNWN